MNRPLMMTIKDTYKLWTEYMRSIALELGIPDSYRMVLTFLLRNPGASQKEIAQFRNITTASVSQIIKEMQLKGYVKKEIDDKDQRYVKLYLTEKGIACANELKKKISAADEKITLLLTPQREEEIIAYMLKLSEIIEKELPKC